MENTKVREYLEKAYEKFDARNVSKAFWLVYTKEDLDPSVKEEMEYAYGAFDLVGDSKKEVRDTLDEIKWVGEKYAREPYKYDETGRPLYIDEEGNWAIHI